MGKLALAISRPILDETRRILREKFAWSPGGVANVLGVLRLCTKLVTPSREVNAVAFDPADNRVVECAIASGSVAIVTGDKDLLRLANFEGIRILRVSDFLEQLASL